MRATRQGEGRQTWYILRAEPVDLYMLQFQFYCVFVGG